MANEPPEALNNSGLQRPPPSRRQCQQATAEQKSSPCTEDGDGRRGQVERDSIGVRGDEELDVGAIEVGPLDLATFPSVQ